MNMKRYALSAAIAAGVLVASTSSGMAQGSEHLRGRIEIDGSSTVYPISEAVASAFRKHFPNVNVTVAISGTGGGFKRFAVGETDISDASRPIKPNEYKKAAEYGVEFIELPVALDGLSIVVNPRNDWVDKLTVEQLRQVYLEKHSAQKWSELNPDWPDKKIEVYAPGTDSGTFDYFHEVMGEEESLRPDMSTSEDDNVLVTGVAGDLYSIGFFGASYYYNNKSKLKAVPVVNPRTGEAVRPTEDNVKNGDYEPFARPLFIYISTRSLRRPETKVFVEFYLKNAAEMATKVDYVPLSETIYNRASQFLTKRWTGTTYLMKNGRKREGRLLDIYKRANLLKSDDIAY